MKQVQLASPLVLAISALVSAQSSVTTSLSASTSGQANVVTSYYSVCPSSSSTTVTLPPTTFTQGMGGLTTVMPQATTILGPDGSVTILRAYQQVMPTTCEGGVCGATYTMYETCPCSEGAKTITIDECPPGFTTAAVECQACAAAGGPSTVTITTPASGGPYASQTPVMGSPVASPAAVITSMAPAAAAPAPNSPAVAVSPTMGSTASPEPNPQAQQPEAAPEAVAAAPAAAPVESRISSTWSNNTNPNPSIAPYPGIASLLSFAPSNLIAAVLSTLAFVL